MVGRRKTVAENDMLGDESVELSDKVSVKRMQVPCNSTQDALSRKHLRENFPGDLPYALTDVSSKIEHAFVEVEATLMSIVTLVLTTPALHENVVWFWDPVTKEHKVKHFELSTFFDGFPLHGGKAAATALSLRILNLPGLGHRPEFLFTLFLAMCKEGSAFALRLLAQCSQKLMAILKTGKPIKFNGYSETLMIPHTNIPLNGDHIVTFGGKNLFAGDAKAVFAAQGCDSSNQRFLPFFQVPTECLCNPDIPLTRNNFVPLLMRQQQFSAVHEFRNLQREIFIKEARELKANTKEGQDCSKAINSLWTKLMKKEVLDEAFRLETGCVNRLPLDIAEVPVTCGLHMDCNEFLRFSEHIIRKSAQLTMELFPASVFRHSSGTSQRAQRNVCLLPDITVLPSHAPLVKTIKVLQDNDLEKVSAFFKKRFTPPPEQSSNIEQFLDEENEELFDLLDEMFEVSSSNASSTSTEERKSSRIRLIGKHVLQLSPIFAKLTSTLKLEEESQQQLSSRIVCCTYAHLMRCLSSLYAEWVLCIGVDDVEAYFLGELFVRLVHRFALHKSANTCLLAQVSPFVIDMLQDTYRLCDNFMLGLGILGRNEGGELTNQKYKQQERKWTPGRPGWAKLVVDQRVEVFMGGLHLLPQYILPRESQSFQWLSQWALLEAAFWTSETWVL